ncbi:hypothetical protein [Streptomyces sp. I6]|uniref:hypothetical protein n=1 Tax=Streptomyces sp. I6 TaxID=2483113 RepID=UPI0028804691|nr:hypothetical protein [Streptomyces sp. I6]
MFTGPSAPLPGAGTERGADYFAAHGTPRTVTLGSDDRAHPTVTVSGVQLGDVLRSWAREGDQDRPLVLFACRTGRQPERAGLPVAQHVANRTGRPVYAPTTDVGTAEDRDGNVRAVLVEGAEGPGRWRLFTPEPTGPELDALARDAGLHTGPEPAGAFTRARALQQIRTLREALGPDAEQRPENGELLAALAFVDDLRWHSSETAARYGDPGMTPDLLRRMVADRRGTAIDTTGADPAAAPSVEQYTAFLRDAADLRAVAGPGTTLDALLPPPPPTLPPTTLVSPDEARGLSYAESARITWSLSGDPLPLSELGLNEEDTAELIRRRSDPGVLAHRDTGGDTTTQRARRRSDPGIASPPHVDTTDTTTATDTEPGTTAESDHPHTPGPRLAAEQQENHTAAPPPPSDQAEAGTETGTEAGTETDTETETGTEAIARPGAQPDPGILVHAHDMVFRRLNTPGDGDCLFRSLLDSARSQGLNAPWTERSVPELRRLLRDRIIAAGPDPVTGSLDPVATVVADLRRSALAIAKDESDRRRIDDEWKGVRKAVVDRHDAEGWRNILRDSAYRDLLAVAATPSAARELTYHGLVAAAAERTSLWTSPFADDLPQALARALALDLRLVLPRSQPPIALGGPGDRPSLYLAYNGIDHYDALVPQPVPEAATVPIAANPDAEDGPPGLASTADGADTADAADTADTATDRPAASGTAGNLPPTADNGTHTGQEVAPQPRPVTESGTTDAQGRQSPPPVRTADTSSIRQAPEDQQALEEAPGDGADGIDHYDALVPQPVPEAATVPIAANPDAEDGPPGLASTADGADTADTATDRPAAAGTAGNLPPTADNGTRTGQEVAPQPRPVTESGTTDAQGRQSPPPVRTADTSSIRQAPEDQQALEEAPGDGAEGALEEEPAPTDGTPAAANPNPTEADGTPPAANPNPTEADGTPAPTSTDDTPTEEQAQSPAPDPVLAGRHTASMAGKKITEDPGPTVCASGSRHCSATTAGTSPWRSASTPPSIPPTSASSTSRCSTAAGVSRCMWTADPTRSRCRRPPPLDPGRRDRPGRGQRRGGLRRAVAVGVPLHTAQGGDDLLRGESGSAVDRHPASGRQGVPSPHPFHRMGRHLPRPRDHGHLVVADGEQVRPHGKDGQLHLALQLPGDGHGRPGHPAHRRGRRRPRHRYGTRRRPPSGEPGRRTTAQMEGLGAHPYTPTGGEPGNRPPDAGTRPGPPGVHHRAGHRAEGGLRGASARGPPGRHRAPGHRGLLPAVPHHRRVRARLGPGADVEAAQAQ